MVDYDKLKNLTPLEFNNTIIDDPDNLALGIFANADNSTGGIFGLVILLAIFILLLTILISDIQPFKFDIGRTILISSAITTIIGIILIATGITNSIQYVYWFAMLFMISGIWVYLLSKKGQ